MQFLRRPRDEATFFESDGPQGGDSLDSRLEDCSVLDFMHCPPGRLNARKNAMKPEALIPIPGRLGWLKVFIALIGAALALFAVGHALALGSGDVAVEGRLHLARTGEDLATIARDRGLVLEDVLQLNALAASDGLWVGQPVRLPAAAETGKALAVLNGVHSVKKGETLRSVALRYGLHPVELAHLNQLTVNAVLFAGQELRVPSLLNWTKMVEEGYRERFPIHVLQVTETMESVAERYGVSAAELRTFNGLGLADSAEAGSELVIPPPERVAALDIDNLSPAILGKLVPLKEKWVEVDLGDQSATAYSGMTPVRRMSISSGNPKRPTVTGLFRIWAKTQIQDMSQGSRSTQSFEHLEGVPWVQYFYQDFALHGAYWPLEAGSPSSSGNILLSEEDAEWLFSWTTPNEATGFEAAQGWILGDSPSSGTLVFIHG